LGGTGDAGSDGFLAGEEGEVGRLLLKLKIKKSKCKVLVSRSPWRAGWIYKIYTLHYHFAF